MFQRRGLRSGGLRFRGNVLHRLCLGASCLLQQHLDAESVVHQLPTPARDGALRIDAEVSTTVGRDEFIPITQPCAAFGHCGVKCLTTRLREPYRPIIEDPYANLAFMTGVVYAREYLWSGAFILAGCLLAMVLEEWNGVVLGPFMGLGMIVPGLMAERRVRTLAREEAGEAAGG